MLLKRPIFAVCGSLLFALSSCTTPIDCVTSEGPKCPWEGCVETDPCDYATCPPCPQEREVWDLGALIDASLENNPETRISWHQARAAAARWGQSKSTYYPFLTLTADATRNLNKDNLSHFTDYSTRYGPSLEINYLLFNFGKRSSTAESARQSLVAANFDFNQRIQDTLLAVHTSYFRLNEYQERLKATEATLKDAETAYDDANERLKQGVGNRQDMLRAFSRVKEAEAQLDVDSAAIEAARSALARAVGLPVGKDLNIAPSANTWDLNALEQDIDQLMCLAVQERPNLLSAYADLNSKKWDQLAAEQDYYPEIRARFFGDVRYFHGRSYNPSENYVGGLFLSWDIFQGFNKKYKVLEAVENRKSAREAVRFVELQVMSQVWESYHAFRSSVSEVSARKASLAAEQEAYNAIALSYKMGVSNLVEVLQSLSDLADARQRVVESESSLSINLANLAYATGTLKRTTNRS